MGLARLQSAGLQIPGSYVLPVEVYRQFLAATGLEEFIGFELGRKDLAELRWEEVWDLSLRIRRHFLAVPWPDDLLQALRSDLSVVNAQWPAVAVRSSAPGEDATRQSFAGLHDSRVMVQGVDAVLSAIRVVWASLWSDGALLYRQELALDPGRSGMAVLVQEMVVGDCSGVLFTHSPREASRIMIEAVWGLNQALVDGTLAPERWELARRDGEIVSHEGQPHTHALQVTETGLDLCALPAEWVGRSPLDKALLAKLFHLGRQVESLLDRPSDLEWTVRNGDVTLLQARPITTTSPGEGDLRPWYLSLHRSLPTLEQLQKELEQKVLPGMQATAERLATVDLVRLQDAELAAELRERYRQTDRWEQAYREKCIPMAHGIRLFGEYYNDLVKPDDPYAFVNLLRTDELLAIARNRRLKMLADDLRADPGLLKQVRRSGQLPTVGPFAKLCHAFRDEFGDIDWISSASMSLADLVLRLADSAIVSDQAHAVDNSREEAFLERCDPAQRDMAKRLLAVARASYALRDNDNLYIGRVRAQLHAAEAEVRRRTSEKHPPSILQGALRKSSPSEIIGARKAITDSDTPDKGPVASVARQLVGQPAVAGLVRGIARVLRHGSDLHDFQAGEVLVCDAIEPNMTFLVPLASAIVERRGGMLIHGAIIAREYGLPCVTGILGATSVIYSGDALTVDGYLGIVTIDRPAR